MVVHRDGRRGPPSSFAYVADAYERGRPGYPEDAVRWLVGDEPCDIVDLGAGTGKLTRSLVALGHRVTAVEPLAEMLEHIPETAPGAFAVLGNAEVIPLPDAYADVVTAAQSFHWFDHAVALTEIARVLRPGARLALVWNTRDDREPWVAKLSVTIGSERLDHGDVDEPIAASGLFGPVEKATFAWTQRLDRATLRDLVLSRSYCASRSIEEREGVLSEVERLFDEHAVAGELELPYLVECYRATKGS
jgi:SAM-dependent methyltransferase